MKGKLFLLAVLFPCLLAAQGQFTADNLPMQGDEAVFSTEFKNLPLTAEDIHKRVTMYVSTRLNAHSGRMVLNNDTSLVCATVDSLVYKKQALAVYVVYMRYNLAFDYADGYCRMTLRDVDFMEKEDYELLVGQRRPDTRGSMTPTAYSAKEIMVDKAFKTLFVKDASGLITDCAIARINQVMAEVGEELK